MIDAGTLRTSKDGFSGLEALMGTDLPSIVLGRCYTDVGKPTNNVDNCTAAGDNHGIVAAETLMDVAPDASLYIANPRTWGDLRNSVEWMQSQGVQVISNAIGWIHHGPGDGTSPYSASPLNTVKWAADNGIVWLNTVGNSNCHKWFRPFTDAEDDSKHE